MVAALQGQGQPVAIEPQQALLFIQLTHPVGLGLEALSGQGDPHHPPRPAAGQGRIQQGVTGRNHHQAVWAQAGADLTLGLPDRLAAAQPADVGRADVGDHRHIGLGTAAEPIDLPQTAHAHFHHHGPVLGGGLQQGEGNADVVVVVAAGGQHRAQGGPAPPGSVRGCRSCRRSRSRPPPEPAAAGASAAPAAGRPPGCQAPPRAGSCVQRRPAQGPPGPRGTGGRAAPPQPDSRPRWPGGRRHVHRGARPPGPGTGHPVRAGGCRCSRRWPQLGALPRSHPAQRGSRGMAQVRAGKAGSCLNPPGPIGPAAGPPDPAAPGRRSPARRLRCCQRISQPLLLCRRQARPATVQLKLEQGQTGRRHATPPGAPVPPRGSSPGRASSRGSSAAGGTLSAAEGSEGWATPSGAGTEAMAARRGEGAAAWAATHPASARCPWPSGRAAWSHPETQRQSHLQLRQSRSPRCGARPARRRGGATRAAPAAAGPPGRAGHPGPPPAPGARTRRPRSRARRPGTAGLPDG